MSDQANQSPESAAQEQARDAAQGAAPPPAANAPKSDAHASLIQRVEGFGEHLEHVIAADFTHIEEAAVAEIKGLWRSLHNLLRGSGVAPTP